MRSTLSWGATGSAVVRQLGAEGRALVYGTLSGKPLEFSPRTLMTVGSKVEGFWLGQFMQKQIFHSSCPCETSDEADSGRRLVDRGLNHLHPRSDSSGGGVVGRSGSPRQDIAFDLESMNNRAIRFARRESPLIPRA